MTRTEDVRRLLDERLADLAANHGVPGVSAAVLVDGNVVTGVSGVLNRRTGVEVTPDSLFQVQSITKVWTATLVMQLVDEGLVELDRPVRAYLPEFRTVDAEASERVTVRHLLTHSGGFEGDLWEAETVAADDALREFVETQVSRAWQYTRPGERWSYCNAGYGTLGRLVEVFRETSYADALRRHLAGPLGIEEFATRADEALAWRTAIGHAPSEPGVEPSPLWNWAMMPLSNPAAGAQLSSSARGLIEFAWMHRNDGVGSNGTRVLSAWAAREMRTEQIRHPAAAVTGGRHGLGWVLPASPAVAGHGGDALGVAADLRVVPASGVAVAVLANGGAMTRLFEAVLTELGDLLDTELVRPIATPETVPVPDPARYVGTYRNRQQEHRVTDAGGGLLRLTSVDCNESAVLRNRAGVAAELREVCLARVEGDTFVVLDPDGSAVTGVEFFADRADGPADDLVFGRLARRVE